MSNPKRLRVVVILASCFVIIAVIAWPIIKGSRYEGLDRAIWSRSMVRVRLWLFLGANVNGDDYQPDGFEKNIPLMSAVMERRHDMAALLLEKGANPNFEYGEGVSPLVFAPSRGDVEMIRLLLSHGARKDMQTLYGTALDVAIAEEQKEAEQFLKEE